MAGGVLSRVFNPFLDAFDRRFDRFAERYHQALEWSLDNRGSVVAMAVATLLGSVLLGMALDRDLLPDVDQGSFDVRLELAEGTLPSCHHRSLADRVEAALLADPGIEAVFSRIGKDVRSYAESEESSGVNTALFQVRLKPHTSTDEVLERVRGPWRRASPRGPSPSRSGRPRPWGRSWVVWMPTSRCGSGVRTWAGPSPRPSWSGIGWPSWTRSETCGWVRSGASPRSRWRS